MKKKGLIALVVLVVLIGAGYFIGKPYYDLHFSTIDGLGAAEGKNVFVPTGSSLEDLSNIIDENGFMKKDEFLSFAGGVRLFR